MSDWDLNFLLSPSSSIKSELPDGSFFYIENNTDKKIYFKIEPNDPTVGNEIFQELVLPMQSMQINNPEFLGDIFLENLGLSEIYVSGYLTPSF